MSRNDSEASMDPNVATASRRRYSAKRERVSLVYLRSAPLCGVTAGTLHHTAPLYADRLARIVASAVAIPDMAFIDRLLMPIDAARAGVVTAPLSPELIERFQCSDSCTEPAIARYLAAPTEPKRRALIVALEKQRADTLTLLLALKAEAE